MPGLTKDAVQVEVVQIKSETWCGHGQENAAALKMEEHLRYFKFKNKEGTSVHKILSQIVGVLNIAVCEKEVGHCIGISRIAAIMYLRQKGD